MSVPAAPSRDVHLVHWLLAHHLHYGLGGYGTGNALTLDAGNRVQMVVVTFRGGRCYPVRWESQASGYDARLHDATFMVQAAPATAIRRVFGAPEHVYRVGATRVLVWHKNLLTDVEPPPAMPGHGSAPPSGALSPSGAPPRLPTCSWCPAAIATDGPRPPLPNWRLVRRR